MRHFPAVRPWRRHCFLCDPPISSCLRKWTQHRSIIFLFSSYLMSQMYLLFTFVSVTCPKISLKLSVAVGSATQQGHTCLPYAMSSIQQPQRQNRTQNHSPMWDISFQDFTSGWIFLLEGKDRWFCGLWSSGLFPEAQQQSWACLVSQCHLGLPGGGSGGCVSTVRLRRDSRKQIKQQQQQHLFVPKSRVQTLWVEKVETMLKGS